MGTTQGQLIRIEKLWWSREERHWRAALDRYWKGGLIRPELMSLERAMDGLQLDRIRTMDGEGWIRFLLHEYFRFKYTAANRYATTTESLLKFVRSEKRASQLHKLLGIRDRLLSFDRGDILLGLRTAREIPGLGVAGASGLVSVMYPESFGIVDQFVVKSLRKVPGIAEGRELRSMSAESLSERNGAMLVNILRKKAAALNCRFRSDFWTPRKVDMVLWAYREKQGPKGKAQCR